MGAHACTHAQAVTRAQMAAHEGLCFLPTVLGWVVESVKAWTKVPTDTAWRGGSTNDPTYTTLMSWHCNTDKMAAVTAVS